MVVVRSHSNFGENDDISVVSTDDTFSLYPTMWHNGRGEEIKVDALVIISRGEAERYVIEQSCRGLSRVTSFAD